MNPCLESESQYSFTTLMKVDGLRVMVPEKGHAKKVKRVTWKQVAVVTLNGHKGLNTFKAGLRWHRHILAGTTMHVRVQLKQGKVWKTKKTLNLTVHRARNPRK